jgi:hypothetical protein
MHNYDSMKMNHAKKVSQTIDSPIMVFDYFELGEIITALGCLMLFGIIIYSWTMMFISMGLVLGLGPVIRKRNKKGIFFHWPYRHMRMQLPGLINPVTSKKYSD